MCLKRLRHLVPGPGKLRGASRGSWGYVRRRAGAGTYSRLQTQGLETPRLLWGGARAELSPGVSEPASQPRRTVGGGARARRSEVVLIPAPEALRAVLSLGHLIPSHNLRNVSSRVQRGFPVSKSERSPKVLILKPHSATTSHPQVTLRLDPSWKPVICYRLERSVSGEYLTHSWEVQG